jgi:hypothetical protein
MNTKTIKLMLLTISLFALLTIAVPAQSDQIKLSEESDAAAGNVKITGSWEAIGTSNIQPPFKTLMNFNGSGGFIGSTQDDLSLSASPAYGVWKRIGNRRYALSFKQILSSANGGLQGEIKVNVRLKLNFRGDEFTGNFQIKIFDLNGNLLFSDAGTLNGNRIQVE